MCVETVATRGGQRCAESDRMSSQKSQRDDYLTQILKKKLAQPESGLGKGKVRSKIQNTVRISSYGHRV